MKKTTLNSNIKAVRKLSSRMPKTINEAISFNEDDDFDMGYDEMDDEEDVAPEKPMQQSQPMNDDIDVEGFIDTMREQSLSIMKSLSKDPDNAIYQFAKKIFQLADKAHEDQKEGKDINGQPKQQQGMM